MTDEGPIQRELGRMERERAAFRTKHNKDIAERDAATNEYLQLMSRLGIEPMPYFSVTVSGSEKRRLLGKPLYTEEVHVSLGGSAWLVEPARREDGGTYSPVFITTTGDVIKLDSVRKDFPQEKPRYATGGTRGFERKVTYDATASQRERSGQPFLHRRDEAFLTNRDRALAMSYSEYRRAGNWHESADLGL